LNKNKELLANDDHRFIGKNLDFYFFDNEAGQGLPLLLPNWVIVRDEIDFFLKKKQNELKFQRVLTPILGSKNLYQTSGHLNHYEENMFPEMSRNNESFFLRPMTCPHHCLIFRNKPRSYKELPFRVCENSILHRYESSGSLKGLERVRCLELSDHHVFVSVEGVKEEFKKNFFFISDVLKKFDLKISRLVCSVSDLDNESKYHNNRSLWDYSEKILKESLEELKVDFVILKGEAAFYGPKLDIEMKSVDGKNITIATIQLDFVLPEKFNLKYVNSQQELKTPVIIHHSPIGAYQRFIAILLEQTKGKLPVWLSPCQIALLPMNDKIENSELIRSIQKKFEERNIRVKLMRDKTLNYRIKEIHNKKIPYYFVMGEREIKDENSLTLVDVFDNKEISNVSVEEIVKILLEKISERN